MDVANTFAGFYRNLITSDEVVEELESHRNGNPLEEFEQHVSSVAKFDPENEPKDAEDLERLWISEDESHGSVQVGGTLGVDSDYFIDWLEVVRELSEMLEQENNDVDLSILAEPSEQSHVMGLDKPERAVLEPDFFTVPRITNTRRYEFVDGDHAEFIEWTEEYIEEEGPEKIITRYVASELEETLKEKVSDLEGWKEFLGNKILDTGVLEGIAHLQTQNYLKQEADGSRTSEAAENVLWDIFWSQWVTEDYFVTNPEASVATKTGADDWLAGKSTVDLMDEVQQIITKAAQADQPNYLDQNLLYIEGSGAQTPFEIIRAADLARKEYDLDIQIIYGGGIENGDDEPDLMKHDENPRFELEYALTDKQLEKASFDPEEFEDLNYDPDQLTGEQQKKLVIQAGADAYIQGNSIQME